MSLLGILKFALKFLHALAWPLFALGYPLCASIRAIESNSNWETQKLVTYWISFSLVSLFEHSFVNLLEWIQFWPHIKLMIICLLVIPYFDGSFYVYNHLVRPCLFINPQVIVDKFKKWMVLLHKRDHFLAEAERYIKENGPEALEKLIANELKTRKPKVDVEEIKAFAATGKKEVEWSPNKEPDTMQKDNEAVEVIEKKEVPAVKQMVQAEPSLDQTDNRTSATMEIKGPAVAVAAAREVPDIHVSKEVQKEWTCDICQLTSTSEKTMNIHLQGKKHKATYEVLKAKNQQNIVPASTAKKTCQPIEKPQKIESTNGLKGSTITNPDEKGQGQSKSVSPSTAKESDHPTKESPSKEPDTMQKDNEAVEVIEKKEVPAVKQMVQAEPNLDQTDNRTSATTEIKGPAVAVAAAREVPDIHVSKEVQKEWTCDICQLTTTSEKTMNIHLQGKKHKATYEALKAKNQPNIVPASTAKKTCQPIEKPQKIESTNVLRGSTITNHDEKGQGQSKSFSSSTAKESDHPTKEVPEKSVSNIGLKQKIIPTDEEKTQGQQKNAKTEAIGVKNSSFRCEICNISCTGDVNFASHLNGKKHLARVVAVNNMIGQSDP